MKKAKDCSRAKQVAFTEIKCAQTATNHLREVTSLRKNTSSPSKSPSLVGYGLMGLLQNFTAILKQKSLQLRNE